MLLSLASAKGAPGTTTSAHVLAAVWPVPILLVDADPAGSDLIYRLRADNGLPLDAERGLLSLAAAMRNNPDAPVEEHTTLVDGGLDVLLGMPRPERGRRGLQLGRYCRAAAHNARCGVRCRSARPRLPQPARRPVLRRAAAGGEGGRGFLRSFTGPFALGGGGDRASR